MICFTEPSAQHLVEALRGQVQHFLHIGTIWVHGVSVEVPTTEMQPHRPFGEYGIQVANWSASVGEAFHAVSPAAVTLRGYAETMAAWFGREPRLRYQPWPEWKAEQSEFEAGQTYDHIAHSPNCSIAKAQRKLGYQPRYGSIEAVCESVRWLIEKGLVEVDQHLEVVLNAST
jgi:hypothetical protein